jgi:hypothetical protein
MNIGIIAWGSIIAEPRCLSLASDFTPTDLCLPVEFCRVSKGPRLTLVIDETFGVPCTTRIAKSALDDLDKAIENLRCREGTTLANIGFVNRVSGAHSKRHPKTASIIAAWVAAHDFDAAVWTALQNNFSDKVQNKAFCTEAALTYLENLQTRSVALDYIRNAPAEVRTPVRTAVENRWPKESAA